jgi:hypothetical protein
MFRYAETLTPLPQYNPDFTVTEDYDFLVRLLGQGDVVSLGEVLLDYRVHGASISAENWKLRGRQSREIAMRHCEIDLSKDVRHALDPFRPPAQACHRVQLPRGRSAHADPCGGRALRSWRARRRG